MTSILVVCTGNICRSPLGEGFLRASLQQRLGNEAPVVRSAGTIGWEGAPAVPESVEVAFERGIDIAGHLAQALEPQMLLDADLVVGMTTEHRAISTEMAPEAADRIFTLKEATRLLEELSNPVGGTTFQERVAAAARLRSEGFKGLPEDEDIIDPLDMPLATYRAVAWEIDEWCTRLCDGIYGVAPSVEREVPGRQVEETT